jgi:hypothetical protein
VGSGEDRGQAGVDTVLPTWVCLLGIDSRRANAIKDGLERAFGAIFENDFLDGRLGTPAPRMRKWLRGHVHGGGGRKHT